jgi:hypothetical protein
LGLPTWTAAARRSSIESSFAPAFLREVLMPTTHEQHRPRQRRNLLRRGVWQIGERESCGGQQQKVRKPTKAPSPGGWLDCLVSGTAVKSLSLDAGLLGQGNVTIIGEMDKLRHLGRRANDQALAPLGGTEAWSMGLLVIRTAGNLKPPGNAMS